MRCVYNSTSNNSNFANHGYYLADISTSLTGSSGKANIDSFRDGLPNGFCNPIGGSSTDAVVESASLGVELNPASFVDCTPYCCVPRYVPWLLLKPCNSTPFSCIDCSGCCSVAVGASSISTTESGCD